MHDHNEVTHSFLQDSLDQLQLYYGFSHWRHKLRDDDKAAHGFSHFFDQLQLYHGFSHRREKIHDDDEAAHSLSKHFSDQLRLYNGSSHWRQKMHGHNDSRSGSRIFPTFLRSTAASWVASVTGDKMTITEKLTVSP